MRRTWILVLSTTALTGQINDPLSRDLASAERSELGAPARLQSDGDAADMPRLLCRVAVFVQPGIVDASAAEKLVRYGLTLLTHNNAQETADAATCLTTLARILESEGQPKEAQRELEHALAIRDRLFGPNHPLVADTLNLLGLTNYHQGRMYVAEQMYGRAVEILRKQASTVDLAAALSNLGNAMSAQGKLKEGEERTREALSIWERLGGPDDPSVAVGLTNLAVLLQARKQYDQAALLLSRALKIDEKKYPPNHPRIGMDLNAAGVLATSRKHYQEAEDLLSRSIAILENGPTQPQDSERGQVLLNLGEVYRLEKKMGLAGDALKRGLTAVLMVWDPTDSRLPSWMDKLALVRRAQEDFAAAEELEMRATRIRVLHPPL